MPRTVNKPGDTAVAVIVKAAAAGDRSAWETLVDRYVGLLWSIALRHGIGEADAADVVQVTWMRLLENIDNIREPDRVGAWLATTARREALRTAAMHKRVALYDDDAFLDGADVVTTPVDETLLDAETAAEARAALETLPSAWQDLMEVLVSNQELSYQDVSALLGIPVGSIGPTRQRCVKRLRAALTAS